MQTIRNIWQQLPSPFFVLAPMDDVTDTVFRQIVADCAAPDLYITEFVNVDGLQSPGRPRLLKKLQFTTKERPTIAQIWGKQPDNFYKTAKELVEMGFDGVDLNMGCPVKAVVKNGCCIALVNNRHLASEIIRATKDGLAGRLPLSVKTRLGLDKVDMTWISDLLNHKLNALIIHGRTAKQLSNEPANWDLIGKARRLRDNIAPDTKIIGNGDVKSYQDAVKLAKRYKLDGVMIGRGVFNDPFIFAKPPAGGSPWLNYSSQQKIELYQKHVKLFAKTWHKGERRVQTLNKFCKIYINGFDGASEMREKLMQAQTTEQLLDYLSQFSSKSTLRPI